MKRGSEAYQRALSQATRHHANSKTYSGRLLRPHKEFLTELIERLGVRSILDYGCGKGEQYRWVDPKDGRTLEQTWGCEVTKYDPAWPPYAAEPQGRFDLVICTHVLGGVPMTDHGWVIERLYDYASRALFVAEKIGKIKKSVHGSREGLLTATSGLDWCELIAPHAREGVETHLAVLLHGQRGKYLGRFVL